jgi:hypothetical protein
MKSVLLITIYLNKTYSKVRIGKRLSDSLPLENGLKQGIALSPLLFVRICHYEAPGKPGGTETE